MYQREKMCQNEQMYQRENAQTMPTSPAEAADRLMAMVTDGDDRQSQPADHAERPLLSVKSVNEWICDAFHRPDPRPLWLSLWHEGEVCCLFADSNLGKSIYAVQFADGISLHEPVVYFDFELSDKQFQLRYTSDDGLMHTFRETFFRSEIDTEAISRGLDDIEDRVIREIENASIACRASKIIIDNLSFLCNSSDKSDMAGRLMMRLLDLKKRRGMSILVLAHTPKRSLTSPITQNDLAGSKKLFNFFDSVFAIGKSAKDPSLRYIKQLKVRAGQFDYGADNVIVAEIVKDGSMLRFETVGTSTEREHLSEQKDDERAELESRIRELREAGKTIMQIAAELAVSKSKVGKIVKRLGL